VLAVLAMRQIHLPAAVYLRRVAGIPLCAGLAVALSAGVRWLAADLPALVSLLMSGTTMVAVFLLLLAYTQGISPRSVALAIKGQPTAEMRPERLPRAQ
jgi:hypothetical protein